MSYKIDGVPQVFGVPIGSIISYLGTSAPEGFVLCDGVARDNTDGKYDALANLGVGHIATIQQQYTPPDFKGMFIGGSSATGNVGGTGGSDNVTLSTSNLPAHSHSGTTSNNGGHNHGYTIHRGNDLNWSTNYQGPYDLGTDDLETDEFGASDAEAGGTEPEGREQRESKEVFEASNRLFSRLAGK